MDVIVQLLHFCQDYSENEINEYLIFPQKITDCF